MRVHQLELTAFGPFAATEVIDFEPLNDAGIFLLAGPTGAGKTTILDAICFGLFGAVPGARNGAKDLKSHHAEASAVPTVTLEVTLRARRFRIRRSPSWSRPSRRARTGRVEEPARASVEELVAGRWVALCTRVDETGLLVSRVLGMNKEQFCQVVMLPQGLFQTFLRAGAKERHDVLEALFETRRFGRIESWLTERRRSCEQALDAQQSRIRALLARAHEVAGDLDSVVEAGAEPATYPAARQLLAQRLAETSTWAALARERSTASSERFKAAQHALDGGRDLEALQARHRSGRERLRDLEAVEDVVASREDRVRRGRAALSLSPLLAMFSDLERAAAATGKRVVEARALCAGSLDWELAEVGGADADEASPSTEHTTDVLHRLDRAVEAQREAVARLAPMTKVEADVRSLAAELSSEEAELCALEAGRAARLEVATSMPGLLAEAREQLRQAGDLAATETSARARLARVEQSATAAAEAARLAEELDRLRSQVADSRELQETARARWLDLRERRLAGMAAELAGQLADGVACLVCGSPRHPAPATATEAQVTAAAEAEALADFNAESSSYHDLLARQSRLQADLAACQARADGLDAEAASAARADAARELEAARQARESLQTLDEQLARLGDSRQALERELTELDVTCELLRARRLDHQTELETKREELNRAVGPDATVDATVRRVRADLQATIRFADALRTHTHRLAEVADVRARLAAALTTTEFGDFEELRAAYLTDVELAVAEALNRSYHDDVRDARRVVGDPVLVEATNLPVPPLADLAQEVAAAEDQWMETASAASSLATRRDRLDDLLGELDAALARWQPLLGERDLAAGVASMCAGISADNSTRTKLSHYVLAARLEQVVSAANLRLSGICGGRYQLEHSMQRGVGDARGGLGLLVLDTHTGQRRDPATLSGGETFYVSLSLALGLADLVRDEVGGAELSTLFVDEGFGMLDSETLDEVIDEIDSLRAGGRCVGLVSHLSELRMRIPTQLRVVAAQRGSTIADR